MAKFKFRLKTVLNVKELKKRQAVVDYAELSRRLEIQQEVLNDIKTKSQEIASLMMNQTSKGIKASDIKIHAAFLRRMDKEIKNQSRVVDEINYEKKNMQAALFKLHNEVGVLESLKQRKQADFLYELGKQEEKKVDEYINYSISKISKSFV